MTNTWNQGDPRVGSGPSCRDGAMRGGRQTSPDLLRFLTLVKVSFTSCDQVYQENITDEERMSENQNQLTSQEGKMHRSNSSSPPIHANPIKRHASPSRSAPYHKACRKHCVRPASTVETSHVPFQAKSWRLFYLLVKPVRRKPAKQT